MEEISNEAFVREMQILWQNLDNSRRGQLGHIIRKYFGEERAEKIINRMQERI